MRVFIKIIILSIFFWGCNRPDPQPELKDPIYTLLQEKLVGFEKDLKFAEGERERAKKYIEDTHPHDPTLKMKHKTYYMNEKDLAKAQQQIKYVKIALDERRKEVRIRYLEAFEQNKDGSYIEDNEVSAFKSRLKNNDFLGRQK